MMLTGAISPSGRAPATHYICTRHDTLEALGRVETYQQALTAAGKSRVPVTLHICATGFDPAKSRAAQKAAHEAAVLAGLGLRRIIP
jgi:hypothetical protein